MRSIDHTALGHIVPLQTLVRDLRKRSAEADWAGNTDEARRLDREADEAIKAGLDPVPMF